MIVDGKEVCHIPGISSKLAEEEHIERYIFASRYAFNKRVLDIACGVGYGSEILANAGAKFVVGCDLMEDNIQYAKKNYLAENLEFKCKDAKTYIEEGAFDLIVCFETIEHVDDCYTVLKNLYNSLIKGGTLIISSPNRKITNPYLRVTDRPSFEFHYREYVRDEFYILLEAFGFSNIEEYGQRHQFYFNSAVLEKYYKRHFKPSKRSSPKVTKCKKRKEPEYFVFVAHKK